MDPLALLTGGWFTSKGTLSDPLALATNGWMTDDKPDYEKEAANRYNGPYYCSNYGSFAPSIPTAKRLSRWKRHASRQTY